MKRAMILMFAAAVMLLAACGGGEEKDKDTTTAVPAETPSPDTEADVRAQLQEAITAFCGLGDKAAESIVAAAAKGRFLSKEDFIDRSKVGSTLADTLDELGILGNIPKTNQLSLFDIELA